MKEEIKNKLKKKKYCAFNPDTGSLWTMRDSLDEARKSMDSNYSGICEVSITKVTILNPVFTDISIE